MPTTFSGRADHRLVLSADNCRCYPTENSHRAIELYKNRCIRRLRPWHFVMGEAISDLQPGKETRGLRLRSFQSWPCKHETNLLLLLFLLLSCRLNTTPPFFFWLVFPEYWLPVNLILFKITYIVIVCDPYRSLIIGEALSERIKKKKCHRRRSGQYTLQCFVLFFFLHLSDTVAAYNLSYTSGEIC